MKNKYILAVRVEGKTIMFGFPTKKKINAVVEVLKRKNVEYLIGKE